MKSFKEALIEARPLVADSLKDYLCNALYSTGNEGFKEQVEEELDGEFTFTSYATKKYGHSIDLRAMRLLWIDMLIAREEATEALKEQLEATEASQRIVRANLELAQESLEELATDMNRGNNILIRIHSDGSVGFRMGDILKTEKIGRLLAIGALDATKNALLQEALNNAQKD